MDDLLHALLHPIYHPASRDPIGREKRPYRWVSFTTCNFAREARTVATVPTQLEVARGRA